MNWLQKTALDQQSLYNIILQVSTNQMDIQNALQRIQQLKAPAPECCEVIMSMYQTYPEGQRALDSLANYLRCQDVVYEQPLADAAPDPSMENPTEMPSVDIE